MIIELITKGLVFFPGSVIIVLIYAIAELTFFIQEIAITDSYALSCL